MDLPGYFVIFSGVSFLFYGLGCLTSPHIKNEFIRFGYDKWRTTTGYLQLLGGAGLLVGLCFAPFLIIISASGLFMMMAYGFGVRLKIRDSLIASSPAFIYAVLNLFLAIHYTGMAIVPF